MDKDVEVRLEALRAAAKVALPGDGVGSLLANTQYLTKYVETGENPRVEVETQAV